MHTTKNKKEKWNNEGFTLVEILVVFALMLILASVSIVGILAYQDYADYKRQNSYAQTLFLAAQTKLTFFSENGQLDELQDVSVCELDLLKIKSDAGEATEKRKEKIYYLMGNRENYKSYCMGEYADKQDVKSRGYQMLYGIFDEFVFDKSILEGNISLEYNPVSGTVYGVLYSDKCGGFTYTGSSENGMVNLLDRREEVRSERMLGYYGVD